jgi:hypothetical protein
VAHPDPKPPVVVGNLSINPDLTKSFEFVSLPGESYTLETSTDLLSPWQELDDGIMSTGTLTTVDSAGVPSFVYDPAEPRRYYRVKLNP